MALEKKIGKVWLYFGWNFKRVAFGISVDRYDLAIDFLFWYLTIEYWGLWDE